MTHTRPAMNSEILLEKVTLEALSALALGPPDHIHDIAPLETALPLIAKAWGLPEETLAGKTNRLERGKKLAAENKGGAPGEPLLECYDGVMIADLLWALFRSAVRLEKKEDRQAIYDAAILLDEGLNLQSFLLRKGERPVKALWTMFRKVVREDDPAERDNACGKASAFVTLLHAHGLAKSA